MKRCADLKNGQKLTTSNLIGFRAVLAPPGEPPLRSCYCLQVPYFFISSQFFFVKRPSSSLLSSKATPPSWPKALREKKHIKIKNK